MKSGLKDDKDGYARKGVTLLIKDEWFEKMFKRECVSAILPDAKFKCKRLRVTIMVACTPCNDRGCLLKRT